MNYIFIHCTCLNNYKEVLKNLLHNIIFSNLYEKVEKIYVFAILKNQSEHNLQDYLSLFGSKVQLKAYKNEGYEDFTLNNIKNFTQDDDNVLYLHTKGVTRYNTTSFNVKEFGVFEIENIYENIEDWVTLMLYFLVCKHEQALEDLKNYDVVGVNFYESQGTPRHFSGNMWYAKASYIKTLPEFPDGIDNEIWILTDPSVRYKTMYNSIANNVGYGHYFYDYKPYRYIDN